jgi:hypothetical protein
MLCPTLFRHIQLIGLGLCLTKHVMPGWEGVPGIYIIILRGDRYCAALMHEEHVQY